MALVSWKTAVSAAPARVNRFTTDWYRKLAEDSASSWFNLMDFIGKAENPLR